MEALEFGPYRLVSRLGRGGMGEVWRAVDTRKDRQVALKVLGAWLGGDEEFAHRFRREAELAAKLNAPHIVPIHDYGEIDGRFFIEMPLIEGTNLEELIRRDGRLPPERAVRIIGGAANALDVAHRMGLVHRDVKPSNILISDSGGGTDFTYLIDFGIARAIDGTRLSLSGAVIGTPPYMAPERFDGDGDARSDIYALSCVLFEAMIGRAPFEANNLYAYLRAHHDAPAPLPSAHRSDLPHAIDGVIARGLAKAPDDRFPTAGALADAARAALIEPASPAARHGWVAPVAPAPRRQAVPQEARPAPTRIDPPAVRPRAVERAPSAPAGAQRSVGQKVGTAAVIGIMAGLLIIIVSVMAAAISGGYTGPVVLQFLGRGVGVGLIVAVAVLVLQLIRRQR